MYSSWFPETFLQLHSFRMSIYQTYHSEFAISVSLQHGHPLVNRLLAARGEDLYSLNRLLSL